MRRKKIQHLKNIMVIIFLCGVIYFFPQIIEFVEKAGVKGVSTKRAKDISSEVGVSVNKQIDAIEKQALNVRVADVIDTTSRLSKIPQDFKNVENYLRKQIDNVIKSKNYGKH